MPRVISLQNGVLLLEELDLHRDGDYGALARMLARVHRVIGPRYGWPDDNYIGLGIQANAWCADWAEFWRDRRMRPQMELARRNGFDLEEPPVEVLLAGHRPEPSLLHGDLWRGNAGFIPGADGLEPVVFDPAVYYGDR